MFRENVRLLERDLRKLTKAGLSEDGLFIIRDSINQAEKWREMSKLATNKESRKRLYEKSLAKVVTSQEMIRSGFVFLNKDKVNFEVDFV
jgi:hypothetical protein